MLALGAGTEAHGKVVVLNVTCATLDPGRPLSKRCTALLKYLDGDPVLGAAVRVIAQRPGRNEPPLGPIALDAAGQGGAYAAGVVFPAYGTWSMRFQVRTPGTGEVELRETVLPPVPGAASTLRAQDRVVLSLGVVDLGNVLLRMVHFLAAVSWFAATAVVWGSSLLGALARRRDMLRTLARGYSRIGGGSFWLMIATGILNAVESTPARSPGVFAPAVIAGLPFGKAYLAAFSVKMALTLAIFATTATLARTLRQTERDRTPAASNVVQDAASADPLGRTAHRFAGITLLLGLLTFASVVVLAYLHVIVHLAASAR